MNSFQMYCVPSKMQPHNVAVKRFFFFKSSSNNETKQMQILYKQIICFVKLFAVKSAP